MVPKDPVVALMGRRISQEAYARALPENIQTRRASSFESLLSTNLSQTSVVVIEHALGGSRLVEQIKVKAPSARVVVVVDPSTQQEEMESSADVILPFSEPNDFARQLEWVLEGPAATPSALVVDDDAASRDLLGELLSDAGFRVTLAKDGHEALRLAGAMHPAIVVLDLRMPGMDGIELSKALRTKVSPQLPILFVSATDSLADKLAAFNAGASDFLGKPVDEERLLKKVRMMVDLSQSRSKMQTLGVR